MDPKALRKRCEERLAEVAVPRPFDLGQFCAQLGESRGRPIVLLPVAIGGSAADSPSGLLIRGDQRDYIIYERDTTPVHQRHIALHEIGHLLCEHGAASQLPDEHLRRLFPTLSPELVRRVLARTSYSTDEESEAEMLASLILREGGRHSGREYAAARPPTRRPRRSSGGLSRACERLSAMNLFIYAVTLACLAALVVKTRELCRDPRNLSMRSLCLVLSGLTVSVGIQPFVTAIDQGTGISRLGSFIGQCAVLVAAGAGQVFLIRIYRATPAAESESRWRHALLLVILAASVVMFVLSPLDPEKGVGAAGHLSLLPRPYLYLYLYFGYVAVTLVAVIRMCLRYAALTEQKALRTGLRILVAGCTAGLAYIAASVVARTMQDFHLNVNSWKGPVTTPLYLTTDALILIGCVFPAWAPQLGAGWRWFANRRAGRRLQPLWLALYRAIPEIALVPLTSGGSWSDTRLQLYRQVIEIRDGQLALRPYVDPRASRISLELAQNSRLTARQRAAVAEAAALAAAIEAKINGIPPGDYGSAGQPEPPGGADVADFAAEIAWLQQVARAFRSPIVARTLQQLHA
ncbi:MAB_1171c family putative transporter [Fodinicola feengrottensis]|uniref:MAB_1171c family putative transporter n=2 Tax=Fodinicola feengrottensis TaxID=435914 RepID=UPI0013D55CE4|nr:MAB_1171c family putative transporter [Fodinicola feengrottensis]